MLQRVQGLVALATKVQTGQQLPAFPAAATGGRQRDVVGAQFVDLLAAQFQPERVPTIGPGEARDPVLRDEMAGLLRQAEVEQGLVPTRVEPAPFPARIHAGAGIGAVAQTQAVGAALGRHQGDLHRRLAIDGLLRLRLEADAGEVVGVRQRLLQREQARLVEGFAALPRHQRIEHAGAQLLTFEARRAEACSGNR